ncbi:MAG: hypothetical protein Q9162_001763 [Coniocarpon cinnabarinum]
MSGLEIPGLVAAIGEIIALGLKSTQRLHALARDVADFKADADRLRLRVEAPVRLLGQIKVLLEDTHISNGSSQLVNDIRVSAQAFNVVLKEIQERTHASLSGGREIAMWRRLKHSVFDRERVEEYMQELSYCSVTLTAFISLLGLEMNRESHSSIIRLAETIESTKCNGHCSEFSLNVYRNGLDNIELPGLEQTRVQSQLLASKSPDAPSHEAPLMLQARCTEPPAFPMPDADRQPSTSDNNVEMTQTLDPSTEAGNFLESQENDPQPRFSMWLGRSSDSSMTSNSRWQFIIRHVSNQAMLSFYFDNQGRMNSYLQKLDMSVLQAISALLESTAAEISALALRYNKRMLRRFLQKSLKCVDLLSKPRDAQEAAMVMKLKPPPAPNHLKFDLEMDRPDYCAGNDPPDHLKFDLEIDPHECFHVGSPPVSSRLPYPRHRFSLFAKYRTSRSCQVSRCSAYESKSPVLQNLLTWAHQTSNKAQVYCSAYHALCTIETLVTRWCISELEIEKAGLVSNAEIAAMKEHLDHLRRDWHHRLYPKYTMPFIDPSRGFLKRLPG